VIDFGAEGDFRRLEGIIRCEGDVQKKDSSRVAVGTQIIQARSHSNTHTQYQRQLSTPFVTRNSPVQVSA